MDKLIVVEKSKIRTSYLTRDKGSIIYWKNKQLLTKQSSEVDNSHGKKTTTKSDILFTQFNSKSSKNVNVRNKTF